MFIGNITSFRWGGGGRQTSKKNVKEENIENIDEKYFAGEEVRKALSTDHINHFFALLPFEQKKILDLSHNQYVFNVKL